MQNAFHPVLDSEGPVMGQQRVQAVVACLQRGALVIVGQGRELNGHLFQFGLGGKQLLQCRTGLLAQRGVRLETGHLL